MLFPENFEQKSGFIKIKNIVLDKCKTNTARNIFSKNQFSTNSTTIGKRVSETIEMIKLINDKDGFRVQDYIDLNEEIDKIKVKGSIIELEWLSQLRAFISTINYIIKKINQRTELDQALPLLSEMCSDINIDSAILIEINKITDDLEPI